MKGLQQCCPAVCAGCSVHKDRPLCHNPVAIDQPDMAQERRAAPMRLFITTSMHTKLLMACDGGTAGSSIQQRLEVEHLAAFPRLGPVRCSGPLQTAHFDDLAGFTLANGLVAGKMLMLAQCRAIKADQLLAPDLLNPHARCVLLEAQLEELPAVQTEPEPSTESQPPAQLPTSLSRGRVRLPLATTVQQPAASSTCADLLATQVTSPLLGTKRRLGFVPESQRSKRSRPSSSEVARATAAAANLLAAMCPPGSQPGAEPQLPVSEQHQGTQQQQQHSGLPGSSGSGDADVPPEGKPTQSPSPVSGASQPAASQPPVQQHSGDSSSSGSSSEDASSSDSEDPPSQQPAQQATSQPHSQPATGAHAGSDTAPAALPQPPGPAQGVSSSSSESGTSSDSDTPAPVACSRPQPADSLHDNRQATALQQPAAAPTESADGGPETSDSGSEQPTDTPEPDSASRPALQPRAAQQAASSSSEETGSASDSEAAGQPAGKSMQNGAAAPGPVKAASTQAPSSSSSSSSGSDESSSDDEASKGELLQLAEGWAGEHCCACLHECVPADSETACRAASRQAEHTSGVSAQCSFPGAAALLQLDGLSLQAAQLCCVEQSLLQKPGLKERQAAADKPRLSSLLDSGAGLDFFFSSQQARMR